MIYTFSQWLFFFYFYCFLGWVWETCYVSACQGKWVNRGFMRGPFLPIYGSGAIIVLIFTLPLRENAAAVFWIGMISATVLEYITGVAMEKLFHVRYWDYSNQKFNLNGHICLTSSLAWGIFSVLLTLYGHRPIENMVFGISTNMIEFLVFILTAYIAVDMTESVREALDLKEMLLSLEENNAEFRRMQKHIEVLAAFYGTELKEKSEAGLKLISQVIESGKEKKELYAENKEKRKEANKAAFLINLNKSRDLKEDTLGKLSEILEAYTDKLKLRTDKEENIQQELDEAKESLLKQRRSIREYKSKEYIHMRGLLKRNPEAISKMHEQAFSELKSLTQQNED